MAVLWEGNIFAYVAVLDTKYNITTHKVPVASYRDGLTIRHFYVLSNMFKDYRFDINSCVMVSKKMPEWHPFFIYLKILYWQIGFSICKKDSHNMISRCLQQSQGILPAGKRKPIMRNKANGKKKRIYSKKQFEAVWQYVLNAGTCPWINNKTVTDLYMSNTDAEFRKWKYLYFALYYMMVRGHKLRIKKIAEAKAIQALKDKQEQESNDSMSLN